MPACIGPHSLAGTIGGSARATSTLPALSHTPPLGNGPDVLFALSLRAPRSALALVAADPPRRPACGRAPTGATAECAYKHRHGAATAC